MKLVINKIDFLVLYNYLGYLEFKNLVMKNKIFIYRKIFFIVICNYYFFFLYF